MGHLEVDVTLSSQGGNSTAWRPLLRRTAREWHVTKITQDSQERMSCRWVSCRNSPATSPVLSPSAQPQGRSRRGRDWADHAPSHSTWGSLEPSINPEPVRGGVTWVLNRVVRILIEASEWTAVADIRGWKSESAEHGLKWWLNQNKTFSCSPLHRVQSHFTEHRGTNPERGAAE